MSNRAEIDADALRSSLEVRGLALHPAATGGLRGPPPVVGPSPRRRRFIGPVQEDVPQISLATVYKALEALEASGLAAKIAGGDGSARFDGRNDDHYHLRCLRSGLVEDLATPFDPDLVAKLDPDLADRLQGRGFRVTGYRLELVGYFEGEGPPRRGVGR